MFELFVDRDLSPHAGIAGVHPRFFFPRVVAELAELRNRVKDPQALAGFDVEAADVALFVLPAFWRAAGHVRGADDDGVLRDDRRRVQADLAGDGIHHLVVVELQIDQAVDAEAPHELARHRVQRDELIAGRDVEHALVVLTVGPVREPASRRACAARRRRACLRARCATTASRRFPRRARRRPCASRR